jgi:lipoprotein-releasing system ATP-binding protein
MTDNRLVLEASGVRRTFRQGPIDLEVLKGVDFAVASGERLAIIGASGSGKTTLLQILGGLDRPSAGIVRIAGNDIHALAEKPRGELRNRTLGFIYQFHHLLPEFSALENAGMPLRIARRPASEAGQRARTLLERVGLGERLTHKPGMLSGGEQQRVAIARALVMEPKILLADEPTGDLDEHTAESLHDLLREMHRERGLTSIIATHNPRLSAACDRILRLEEGKLRDAR